MNDMSNEQYALIHAVEHLIDTACHYRLDELGKCYAPDLQILIVQEDGSVLRFNREQNMAFFRERKESGAPPINTRVHFHDASKQDGIGYVVASRQMDLGLGEKRILFTLMLRQSEHGWQVFREHAVILGDA